MSDSEVIPEIDQSALEDEVDALFMKTQQNILEQESYDMYIPLSVQIDNAQWNKLMPSNSIQANDGNQDEITDSNEPVSFPISHLFDWIFMCRQST